ncbi:ATP-dependent RNA helicase glh-2-like isoform X3 [Senna tora]|uniref:ATP-dependent RNA helicase glh-2-like isoform X3 n=1 Tax=Senna tora TaxID=362788 RepID=A0A834T2V9_9FABA|nr:ATP-dependent RNA helicase glh-2-like isoform X3 [Senna tora]
MSQREGIVEDVNDESSAHHEAPPPPPSEGRGRGRSSGFNRGRGRPRGRGRTSRGGRAIEHLINDELVGNPMPQQNLASTQDVVLTGLQGVTRAVKALTSIIVDHVARTNTPAGEAKEDDAAKKRKRGGEDRYGGSSTGGFSKGTKAHTHQRFSQSPSGFSAPSYVSPNRQRTDSQNTKSSTQQGSSQQKHNKSSCPTCGKFHSGLCYRGSGACYRCGKVGHLIRDCPQQRPESSQGSIQPTGHTTSSMGQSRGPSSNRSVGFFITTSVSGSDSAPKPCPRSLFLSACSEMLLTCLLDFLNFECLNEFHFEIVECSFGIVVCSRLRISQYLPKMSPTLMKMVVEMKMMLEA